jgi:hypothetical protein
MIDAHTIIDVCTLLIAILAPSLAFIRTYGARIAVLEKDLASLRGELRGAELIK